MPTGKVAFGLGLIWACVLCLGQAARFYVHLVSLTLHLDSLQLQLAEVAD